ncbi:nephrin isoform X2 [Eupeodes corollae]|uniref:nephrin isoform X2 n=1 Tax=Eupeodes corollae TaxID=290404 RepID=UPI0024936DFE|nr:nephrin isoform X2 [Eupeodes corollae]
MKQGYTMAHINSQGLSISILFGLVLAQFPINIVTGQQQINYAVQSFRTTPHDVHILEGTDTLLRCEISNRVGKVQWTKDGFALGFSTIIPGYPRYSVIGDFNQGVYNLQISNTTLEDDAEYQCQVGPAKGNPAIRANAKLNIIAAPTSIQIDGYGSNSRVEVIEKQNLTLKCIVENAKPAAEIVWYRGNMEYTNAYEPEVQVKETQLKTFTTTSTITIRPSADDDYKDFSCQAKHRALPPDVPMRANIHLSVLYPPGPPFFEGYSTGENLRRGQNVEIACRSRGGNPPAQLVWFKNGQPIVSPQKNMGRLSENVYKFVAEPSDNGAKLTCEAKNILSEEPLKADLELSVTFSPSEVTISGPTEALAEETVQLSCSSAPSNPIAEISWSVDGQQMNATNSKSQQNPEGGWITVSNLSVTIGSNKRFLVAVCHGFNAALTEAVVATHTINILHAPSAPSVTGYTDGQIIVAGSIQKLTCTSAGGNPPPTLIWYKNDKKLNSVSKLNGNTVISELTILANASDNQARYKCHVESKASDIPLFEVKTLQVYFPPETVKIRIEPKDLHPGTTAKLICDSSSSNPPAMVSWWKDGIPVNGANPSNRSGLWGGSVSTLELFINITQEMHDSIYTCQSINEALQRSAHETISLDILYPPKFATSQPVTFTGVEGEPLQIPLVATANPMTMSFTWTKDGFPISSNNRVASNERILAEGPVLNIIKLERTDAGRYTCEAMNSQGTTTMSVLVIVEYAPDIESISDGNIFAPGQDAVLSCSINGKPLTEDHVRWERSGYDMATRTTAAFVNGTSYLHIKNVQHSDVGNFTCMVDNQRGAMAQRDVLLIVESAPKVDKFPSATRFAAGLGERGILQCTAQGAPTPMFVWRKNGKEIKMYRRNKFRSEEYQIDKLSSGSRLFIESVLNDDYGVYECVAKNMHGESSAAIQLNKPSRPESPQKLMINNVTDNSVLLSWIAGFDGGLPVYYRIRYRQLEEDKYKYVEARPNFLNATISGLQSNTVYVFSVMAANEAGGSKFLPDMKITISTNKSEAITATESSEKNEMPNLVIIGITSAAMILLILNAALVAWFVIRRQNKDSAESEHQADDAYSKDDNQSDYKGENHKKAASTYLVENVDIIQSASFPPKYQESSLSSPPYTINADYTKTLPNPKRHAKIMNDNRSKDDHMLVSNGLYIPSPSPASSLVIKGSYISSPSPAPPPDGSYFNMSDKYLSYPPVVY